MLIFFSIVFIILFLVYLVGKFGLPEKELPMPQDPDPSQILPGAEPFELPGHGKNHKVGILLIHGFEGSPFTFQELGRFLNKKGYHIIAPLLPGHGTSEKDFAKTRYRHWYKKVEDIYFENRNKFQYFFVIGFSMGGNLALKLAENFHDIHRPSGILILSAPVFFNGFFNGKFLLMDWRLLFSGIVKIFLPHFKKSHSLVNSDSLSPWVGYNQYYTMACLHSFKVNLPNTRVNLWKINAPILLIHARNDRTVNFQNQVYIYNHVRSRQRLALSFNLDDNVSSKHILTTHLKGRGRAFHYIDKFIEDAMVDFENLLSPEKPGWKDKLRFWQRGQ